MKGELPNLPLASENCALNECRWAWIPQVLVLFVLAGSASSSFDTTVASVGDTATINANRLSFFSLYVALGLSWAASAADYFVYYPENTPRWTMFTMTMVGLVLSFSFVNLLGIGLATGVANNPAWADRYNTSAGALILAGYGPLAGFGKFCGVIVSLGVISNNIPGTYSAAISMQVLGRYAARVPRWLLTCLVVLIYTACALGGRDSLFAIFQNFLALMGYWVAIWICIVLEENYIFHRGKVYDWTIWQDWRQLPLGAAALAAFLVGWAGSIVSMDQVYFVGPIAKMVGANGADLGIWVGCAWTLLAFPPLRLLELKVVGR